MCSSIHSLTIDAVGMLQHKKTCFNQAKHDLGVRKSRNADRYLHFGITVDGSGMLQHSKKESRLG